MNSVVSGSRGCSSSGLAVADTRAGAAASPRLEEGRARTLKPRPGGSPAPWKQPLPVPEPGVVAFVWDEEIRIRGTIVIWPLFFIFRIF